MTIQYDPHMAIEDNMQRGETHSINVSQSFRVVVPTHAPFYYSSLVVKQGSTTLVENKDYYVSHNYQTGALKTGMLCYGSIWIINEKLGGDITLDYHPLGIAEATSAQITTERARNSSETPTDLDWEEVVGETYFPPVEIKFDRDDWHGETELINSLNSLGCIIEDNGWQKAVAFEGQNPRIKPVPAAVTIAPIRSWYEFNSIFMVKKELDIPSGKFTLHINCDNLFRLYIDGEEVWSENAYASMFQKEFHVTPGKHTIAISAYNGTGPGFLTFSFVESGTWKYHSDETWPLKVITGLDPVQEAQGVGNESDLLTILRVWYESLKHLYETAPAHAHVTDHNNPHNEEYGWIHALERDGVSPNALKVFNKTLAQLTHEVNVRAPQAGSLSNKVRRSGGTLKGAIVLKEGLGMITSTVSDPAKYGNKVDVSSLLTAISSAVSINVEAGKTTPQRIKFQSGHNALILYPDSRGLEYNGKPVVTEGNIGPLVPQAGTVSSNVYFESSPTVYARDNSDVGWESEYDRSFLDWPKAVLHTWSAHKIPHPSAIKLSPTERWALAGGYFGLKKEITLEGSDFHIDISFDDSVLIWVDGVKVPLQTNSDPNVYATGHLAVVPGKHTVAIQVHNGGGPGSCAFAIYDKGTLHSVSDTSWFCRELNLSPSGAISVEWKHPEEEDGVLALRKITSSFGTSKTLGATPKLVRELKDKYPLKLTTTAQINGKRLSGSVVLSKLDFGLHNVENYSDLNMPISDAQRTLLDSYTVGAHTHPATTFGITAATKTTKGLVELGYVGPKTNIALLSDEARALNERIPAISDRVDQLMPEGVISITRYGASGNGSISDVSVAGWVATITSPINYYCNSKLYELPPTAFNIFELFPSSYQDKIFYVYANVIEDTPSYEVHMLKQAENDTLTEIGTIVTSTTATEGIFIRNVTRLGHFREMGEHIEDSDAHVSKPKDRDELGLGSFINASPAFDLAKPTFQQVFDTWYRFSHGGDAAGSPAGVHPGLGNAQPANPAENSSWIYDSEKDAIIQPVNCGTFVGFISPKKYEDYVFDTILSSDQGDNDAIGVVLGFYTDESGRERTLSLVYRQDTVAWLGHGVLTIDYMQSDQIFLKTIDTNSVTGIPNWNVTGQRRLKVTRTGDILRLEFFHSGDNENIQEWLRINLQTGDCIQQIGTNSPVPITFDPTHIARLTKFRGAQPFGYCSHSQPGSTYTNIQRPDEDGRNFYATMPELLGAVSPLSAVRVYSGESAGLLNKTLNDAPNIIPRPTIKNYQGETITVPLDRIRYHIKGTKWVAIAHLDATLLGNKPT